MSWGCQLSGGSQERAGGRGLHPPVSEMVSGARLITWVPRPAPIHGLGLSGGGSRESAMLVAP